MAATFEPILPAKPGPPPESRQTHAAAPARFRALQRPPRLSLLTSGRLSLNRSARNRLGNPSRILLLQAGNTIRIEAASDEQLGARRIHHQGEFSAIDLHRRLCGLADRIDLTFVQPDQTPGLEFQIPQRGQW